MKADWGRLEKKFKLDNEENTRVDWQSVGYAFIASDEGFVVERL
jgi:hypothetical protein